MKEYTDEELYNFLKDLPEFENLPLPESWYKKFNIELKAPETFKQVVESNYIYKSKMASKGLILAPTPKDYVFPEIKTEPVPLHIESKVLQSSLEQDPKVTHDTVVTVLN